MKLVSKFWSIFFSEKVPKYSRQQASIHKSIEIVINISHMCINTNLRIDVLQIVGNFTQSMETVRKNKEERLHETILEKQYNYA